MSSFLRVRGGRIRGDLYSDLFRRFIFTGTGGALLSILTTWALTAYVFGVDNYFSAYLIGIAVNLVFNFVMYTIAVFKTTRDHARRLAVFLFYGVIMAFLQGTTVQLITAHLGVSWYLLVIAGVIAGFALLNFFVFKLSIFKELGEGEHTPSREVLAFIILCGVLLRVAVLFHVLAVAGVAPLVYGDAIGYRETAIHLSAGDGFSSLKGGVLTPEVFRTPGLPLLLAPFATSDDGLALYLFILAVIAGILLPSFTYRIARRMLPSGAALVAAALVAFEPHLVFFSVLPLSEVPFILFAYGAFVAALLAHERRAILWSAFAGALLGYAILIRPGFLPVFIAALLLVLGYQCARDRARLRFLLVTLVILLATLTPWYVRTHRITGVYSLSEVGWRNVYTNYLASVRAMEKHTDFAVEKSALIQQAPLAGVRTEDINNPTSGPALRNFSLKELWEKKATVAVLEPALLASYFTHDGYYFGFRRFLLVPSIAGVKHESATFALLNKGFAGVGDVMEELSRQLFIPIAGRAFTVLILLGAIWGFFVTKSRLRFLFVLVIALSALTATAIGFGVESRLRLPVEPLLFILVASACIRLLPWVRFLHENREH